MRTFTAICFSGLLAIANADIRTWSDKTGRTLEADFMTMDDASITVRTKAGKVVILKKDSLADGEWEEAKKLKATAIDPTNAEGTKLEDASKPWLSAKTSSWSTDATTTWATSWGSYNKTIDQTRVVEVSVRSRSDSPSSAIVEVIWLSNGTTGKGLPTGVCAVSRATVDLKAREVITCKVPMSFSIEKEKYAALGVSFETGGKYAGWVARLVDPVHKTVICQFGNNVPNLKWSDTVPVYVK